MLSYTNRRKRWWSVLQELGSTMMLSDSLRAELLLELSGLSRQEIFVSKACAVQTSKAIARFSLTVIHNFTSEKVARHDKAALHLCLGRARVIRTIQEKANQHIVLHMIVNLEVAKKSDFKDYFLYDIFMISICVRLCFSKVAFLGF